MKQRSNAGFSLVEILVVLVIMGLLISVVAPTVLNRADEALVEPSTMDPEPRNFKEGGYLSELPVDPWGRPYLYLSPGEHGEIDIYSLGADGLSGGEDQAADIGNWKAED
jgi:general secretion pathway protein G